MKFIIKILILMFSLNLFSQLELKLEKNYADKVVKCEPIWVKMILENKSSRKIKIGVAGVADLRRMEGFYFLVNGREYRGPWRWPDEMVRYKLGAKNYLDKGERKEKDIDLRIMALPEGKYDLEAVLELEGKVYKSNKIELEIEQPIGEDEEAYRYAEKNHRTSEGEIYNIRFIEMCRYLTENRDFMLEKYPTSTYAGWAMPIRIEPPNIKDKKACEIELKKIKKILNGIEFKEILKEFYGGIYINALERFYEEKYEKEIEDLKKIKELSKVFTDSNPYFSFAGYILATGGYNALYLGEFNQACDMLKRSIGMKWQKPYIKKEDHVAFLKEVIKLLEEKCFCK